MSKRLTITFHVQFRKFPHEDFAITLPGVANPQGEKKTGNPFLEYAGRAKTWILPSIATHRNSTAEEYIRGYISDGENISAEEFGWIQTK